MADVSGRPVDDLVEEQRQVRKAFQTCTRCSDRTEKGEGEFERMWPDPLIQEDNMGSENVAGETGGGRRRRKTSESRKRSKVSTVTLT